MKICSRCVMDEATPEIVFDDSGECNYCKLHDELSRDFPNDAQGTKILSRVVEQVKEFGRGKRYDCLVGTSGGTDSTYLVHLAKEMGLRPLAMHLDCGWDTEIAVSNIKNSLEVLNVDLYTYVVDWEEMRDLYRACFKGTIPWPDGPTDTAILATMYKVAAKFGIKYVFTGNNFRTEGRQPSPWTDFDGRILSSLHRQHGHKKLRTFPNFTIFTMLYYGIVRGVKMIRPFYYIPYNKSEAKKMLAERYHWRDYGGHHHESILTRYVIGVWLPKKFGIDKRKVTLSAQIRSGEINRDESLRLLAEPAYDTSLMASDEEYIIKKLGFSREEFDSIWRSENRQHTDYPNYSFFYNSMSSISEQVFRWILPWKPMMFYRLQKEKV
jgi:N-acetyl sugar amidotransferase